MKKMNLLPVLLALGQCTYAQVESGAMGDEFQQISKFSSRATGFEGFQSYSSGIVEGSQFFYPDWTRGTVTTKAKETIGKNYLFLFDKVRQELFMKWKDSSYVLLADKNQIGSFTLNTDQTHYFVPADNYDPAQKGAFFEALVENKKGYSLLKSIKTKFVTANPNDMEKQKSGDVYDSYVDEITYYISYQNSIPQKVSLKQKSIKKVLEPVKSKVDRYFSLHANEFVNESFLTGLVESLNG